MPRELQVRLYVVSVVSLSLLATVGLWELRLPFPGWWPVVVFLFVANVLESSHTRLRIAARGSTSFIIHIAATLLFGGWWVGAIAAIVGQLD